MEIQSLFQNYLIIITPTYTHITNITNASGFRKFHEIPK
jgi:hypothetical protein